VENEPVGALGVSRYSAHRVEHIDNINPVVLRVESDRQTVVENLLTGSYTDKTHNNNRKDGRGSKKRAHTHLRRALYDG